MNLWAADALSRQCFLVECPPINQKAWFVLRALPSVKTVVGGEHQSPCTKETAKEDAFPHSALLASARRTLLLHDIPRYLGGSIMFCFQNLLGIA